MGLGNENELCAMTRNSVAPWAVVERPKAVSRASAPQEKVRLFMAISIQCANKGAHGTRKKAENSGPWSITLPTLA
jgi:hypothetical protein